MKRFLFRALVMAVVGMTGWAGVVHAGTTIKADMTKLVGNADLIVLCSIASVEPGKVLSFTTTKVTCNVEEVAKGTATVGTPLVFSQIITKGDTPYRVGQRAWLMLGPESCKLDPAVCLRAPIGLEQGVFTVRGEGKEAMVENGRKNMGLFLNLPASKSVSKAMSTGGLKAETSGPITAESFRQLVDALK